MPRHFPEPELTPLRLGILDAVPAEYYLAGEKTDPDKFIDMFRKVPAPMAFRVYRATEGHFPLSLDECDAYLITGSPCSVYDTYTWIRGLEAFVRSAWGTHKPLVGICFGHQLIARTLGGCVELAEAGWLLGLHEISVRVEKPWMQGEGSRHGLFFINQDQVVRLPRAAERLADSDACANVMFTVDRRILALQAHPEQPRASMRAFSRVLLERYGLDSRIYDAALDSMDSAEPDAPRVAGWISTFLLDACGRDMSFNNR